MTSASQDPKPVWADRMTVPPDAMALEYTAGRDVRALEPADAMLAPYDIWTNAAHVAMLADCSIIGADSARQIGTALAELQRQVEAGEFRLDQRLEDIHINVENLVAGLAWDDVAGLMHTARSRNDQALTYMRLFLRDAITDLATGVVHLAMALGNRAVADAGIALPGLTHTQPGAVTSLGHWWASHAQALERDLAALRALETYADQSPLGAAASFGSTWPIDRRKSAEYLGFTSVQSNSLDCVSSRGELETRFASAAAVLMNHISALAQDLIVLSSFPRRYITLSDAYVTGSSIMPQKRNPDFCEVTRAKASLVHGLLQSLLGVNRASLSGYNRDQQWTKYMMLDLYGEIRHSPAIFAGAMETLTVQEDVMLRDARSEFLNAVEIADLVSQQRSVPFRKAHALVAEACRESGTSGRIQMQLFNAIMKREGIGELTEEEWQTIDDPLLILKRRQSLGSPNPYLLGTEVAELQGRLGEELDRLARRREAIARARAGCMERLLK